jgi:hypothetical protein
MMLNPPKDANLDPSMSFELNRALIVRSRLKARKLSLSDRIVINLLYDNKSKDSVSVPILARVFKCSKNTIYYKSLTGRADSYPTNGHEVSEVEREIALLGREEAKRKYLTDKIMKKVRAEVERTARRKERR